MNNTQIIQPVKIRVTAKGNALTTLNKDDIANIAQSLIVAAGDNDTRRGIALLAMALGCDVKEAGQ